MKTEQMLEYLGDVKPEFVEEAAPKGRRPLRYALSAAAAVLVILGAGLMLRPYLAPAGPDGAPADGAATPESITGESFTANPGSHSDGAASDGVGPEGSDTAAGVDDGAIENAAPPAAAERAENIFLVRVLSIDPQGGDPQTDSCRALVLRALKGRPESGEIALLLRSGDAEAGAEYVLLLDAPKEDGSFYTPVSPTGCVLTPEEAYSVEYIAALLG